MEPAILSAEPVRLAIHAMRCRFEIALFGDDPASLRAAGEEALREIQSVDRRMNAFAPASELTRLNGHAATQPVIVSPALYGAIEQAHQLSVRTRGAFDPTLGPLVRLWRRSISAGALPSEEELKTARTRTGTEHVRLDPETRTVFFLKPGMELNLNALAKGLAIDAATTVLEEAGVTSAILQGGTSSIRTLGAPPDAHAWSIGLADPEKPNRIAHRVELKNEALGISSQGLQAAPIDGADVGHVISPLTGHPVPGSRLAAVMAPTAAVADALSTAVLVSDPDNVNWLLPDEEGLIVPPGTDGAPIRRLGERTR